MLLSDVDIKEKIANGDIEIVDSANQPLIDKQGRERDDRRLQSHGYDLRPEAIQNWKGEDWHKLADGENYPLKPDDFVVVQTYERVRVSPNIAATISAMARQTLLGLAHISTTVHPGWAFAEKDPEPFYVAVANLSRATLYLNRNEGFCRLMFYETKSPARKLAPTKEQVKAGMDNAIFELKKQYGWRAQLTGWLLIVLVVGFAAALLYGAYASDPGYLGISIPPVVALLTVVLAWLRRKFNIVPP